MANARHVALVLTLLAGGQACGRGIATTPPVAPPPAPAAAAPGAAEPSIQAAPAVPGSASIAGRVFDRQTGNPVRLVRVELVTLDGTESRTELSDATGQYSFDAVREGSYVIRAWKAGYAVRAAGQAGPIADSPILEIQPGGKLDQVDIRLVPGATIAGRVRDADGRPVAWAIVEAQRAQAQAGQLGLATMASAQTDEQGLFRIFGLPGGTYLIAAHDAILEGGELDPRSRRFAPTYYPGVVFLVDARPVRVEPGGAVDNIDLELRFVPSARVSGRVVSYDRRRLLSGSVNISPFATSSTIPLGPSTGALMAPDGSFVFTTVPPGRYIIRARGETESQGTALFGTFLTSVEGQDIANILITLKPGASVSGTVEFETTGAPLPDVTRIFVAARLVDTGLTSGATEGFLRQDGTFSLSTMDSERILRLENLPAPWVLKSVLYRGRDVTDRPLTLESGDQLTDIRIIVTNRVTTLTGTVRDAAKQPVPDRVVVTLPIDQALWRPNSRYIRLVYPSMDGRYQIRGLPPGEYFVAAVEPLDEADLIDPAVLEGIAAIGTRVTLREGQSLVLDLSVSQPEPRVASR